MRTALGVLWASVLAVVLPGLRQGAPRDGARGVADRAGHRRSLDPLGEPADPFFGEPLAAGATGGDGRFALTIGGGDEVLRVSRVGSGTLYLPAPAESRELGDLVLHPPASLRVHLESKTLWDPADWRIEVGRPLGGGKIHWNRLSLAAKATDRFVFENADAAMPSALKPDPEIVRTLGTRSTGLIENLAHGPLRIALATSGTSVKKGVSLQAGKTTELTLRIPSE